MRMRSANALSGAYAAAHSATPTGAPFPITSSIFILLPCVVPQNGGGEGEGGELSAPAPHSTTARLTQQSKMSAAHTRRRGLHDRMQAPKRREAREDVWDAWLICVQSATGMTETSVI